MDSCGYPQHDDDDDDDETPFVDDPFESALGAYMDSSDTGVGLS